MKKVLKNLIIVSLVLILFCCSKKQEEVYENDITPVIESTQNNTFDENAKAEYYIEGITEKNIETDIYLSYIYGISKGKYKWVKYEEKEYYALLSLDEEYNPKKGLQKGYEGVYINANITNKQNQMMIVYAPKEYFTLDQYGNVTGIDYETKINGYTAKTAPVIFSINTENYESVIPKEPEDMLLKEGYVYVSCGMRGYDSKNDKRDLYTGKITRTIADLKSAIIALRANWEVIPGDTEKIIAVGSGSGANLAALLGVTGDISEYYEFLYDVGAIGVALNGDGTYNSAIHDSIYATYVTSPITNIENLDMETSWMWNSIDEETSNFSAFDKSIQKSLSLAFENYINSKMLIAEGDKKLEFNGERDGSYYFKIIDNLSKALNNAIKNGLDIKEEYENYEDFTYYDDITKEYVIIDIDSFIKGIKLKKPREKRVLSYDTVDKSTENRIFGFETDVAKHFSLSIANMFLKNKEALSKLEGYDEETIEEYLNEVFYGPEAVFIEEQRILNNPTHILLELDGIKTKNTMKHYKCKDLVFGEMMYCSPYNLYLALKMKGVKADYELIWDAETKLIDTEFIDWVEEVVNE